MCKLRPHENVVTFYGVCPNPLAIVTAFASGGALDEFLQSKHGLAASRDVLLGHLSGAARGLAHLHAEGFCYFF